DGFSEKLTSRSNRNLNCAGANFGNRVALSLSDLLLGKCGTARDVLLGASLGLGDEGLGLMLRSSDDVGRFLLGFLALLLVLGQQLLGFLAELARLFQLVADAIRTGVEGLGDHGRQASKNHQCEEQDETYCCPECSVHDPSSLQP